MGDTRFTCNITLDDIPQNATGQFNNQTLRLIVNVSGGVLQQDPSGTFLGSAFPPGPTLEVSPNIFKSTLPRCRDC